MRRIFAWIRLITLGLVEDYRSIRRELKEDVRSVLTGDIR